MRNDNEELVKNIEWRFCTHWWIDINKEKSSVVHLSKHGCFDLKCQYNGDLTPGDFLIKIKYWKDFRLGYFSFPFKYYSFHKFLVPGLLNTRLLSGNDCRRLNLLRLLIVLSLIWKKKVDYDSFKGGWMATVLFESSLLHST